MALRFLLVGLVIGLGVELPSGDEIASWVRAGSDWVQARIDGALGPEALAEAKPTDDAAFAAIVDEMAGAFASDRAAVVDGKAGASPSDDAAFAAIVDEMAGAFASDRALAERPAPPKRLAFEPIEVPDDPESDLGFALNRESQGEGRTPEPAAIEIAKAPAAESTAEGRLASAIRLTREAGAAWANVLRGAEATVRVR